MDVLFNLTVGGKVNVTGNVLVIGDINATGNITGNQIYGEMWNKGDYSGAVPFETVDLVTPNVYVQIKNLTTGELNGFTHVNETGNLTVQVAGLYNLNANVDVIPASVGGQYGMKVYVNDVGYNKCYDHKNMAVEVSALRINCDIRVSVGDNINIRFDDHSNPVRDLELYYANVNSVRIGD